MASPATVRPRSLNVPRLVVVLLFLGMVLPDWSSALPAIPFSRSSSSSSSVPSSSSSLSSSSLGKRGKRHQTTDCNNDLEVSAICYNCAALSPKDFHTIHSRCCVKPGPVRELCVGWYTEEPKKGRVKYF